MAMDGPRQEMGKKRERGQAPEFTAKKISLCHIDIYSHLPYTENQSQLLCHTTT